MFLALTLLLTLLEISFSRPNRPRPRPRRRLKGGRTGLDDAYLGTEEYEEYDCDTKIYDCEDYSHEELNVTPPPNTGDDCDEQIYDCDNYSYEEVAPPPPAPAAPAPPGNGRSKSI